MTLLDAIAAVLAEANGPLHYEVIAERVIDRGLWQSEGRTPHATVVGYLAADIKKHGTESVFQRTAPGTYALRAWGLGENGAAQLNALQLDASQLDVSRLDVSRPGAAIPASREFPVTRGFAGTSGREHKVRTPLFPRYSWARALVKLFDGVARSEVYDLINAIGDQTGTPQNPVDWSDPDTWISQRLSGDEAALAARIWRESGRTVNPRHIYGSYLFINTYGLLDIDAAGVYRMNDRGRAFLAGDEALLRELDDAEGMARLLAILATKTRAKASDLLPEWSEFLREHSRFATESTFKDTLRRRSRNLVERGLAEQDGIFYSISPAGLEYLKKLPRADADDRRDVGLAISGYNARQRELLRSKLSTMSPYRFEELIGDLLEAMGYEDVTVTKESGDKGVDVVATVQFGITTITEVVQVKRQQGNIGRPILDQLRGALPYHKALRGTIITTGKFSSGCLEAALFPGAAPIGLIDGERLLDLLIEHEIGVRKRPAQLYDVDEETFGPA